LRRFAATLGGDDATLSGLILGRSITQGSR